MKKAVLFSLFIAALGQSPAMAANPPAAPAAAAAKAEVSPFAGLEVPDAVLAEMNTLVEKAIQGAAGPLHSGDEFEPYGVLQSGDGTLQVLRWNTPNPPPAQEVFRQIFLAMRAEAVARPQVVAAVTVAATSAPTTDGASRVHMIRAEVDHRQGAPRMVLIPYTRANGKLELGTPIYQMGNNAVFDHSARMTAGAGKKPAAKAKAPARPAAAKAAASPKAH